MPEPLRWVPPNPGGNDKPRQSRLIDVSGYDAGLPILLVPVALETKFVTAPAPGELRIRIIPDQVSVAADAPPSAAELEAARSFWENHHGASTEADRSAAWRRYVGRLGPERAGYVARLVRPRKSGTKLVFPDVEPEDDKPARAELLPRRWMAMGWVGEKLVFREYGAPIQRPVFTSPDPLAPTVLAGDAKLKIDRSLRWMFDYDAAVRKGMAITVPFTDAAAAAADGLSMLMVLGLDADQDPANAAAELGDLFDSHQRSVGLAFVPQGTPTNNTKTVPSGHRWEQATLAELEEIELGGSAIKTDANATRFAGALGLRSAGGLSRALFGSDPEWARSRDSRTALFEAVIGTYVRQLLGTYTRPLGLLSGALTTDAIGELRTWFTDWVTGGAPVPALRVGAQPYGVLPTMRRTVEDSPTGVAGHVAALIDALLEEWRAALVGVQTLDHNATDDVPDDAGLAATEAREAVTAVLANNPHPRRIAVRGGRDWADNAPIVGAVALGTASVEIGPGGVLDPTLQIPLELPGGFRYEYDVAIDKLNEDYATTLRVLYDDILQRVLPPRLEPGPIQTLKIPAGSPRTEADIRTIEQQIEIWVQTDASIDQGFVVAVELAEAFPEFHAFCADMIERLERHELRQRPLRWLSVPGFDGVLGRDNNQLLLTRFDATERLWTRPIVSPDEPLEGQSARDYLLDLAVRIGQRFPRPPLLPEQFDETAPLLYQLLDATVRQGDNDPARKAALERLAEVDPASLDWLVRETLGLGTNRLDAWHTSLATERLGRMREAHAEGVYVGSYGFVLDLAPSDGPPSSGFIHAPSLPHAQSAAVLRSGWLARGGADPATPAAVDLRSDRVRAADWLIGGIRNGQELGALLGYRFERALHDNGLSVAIRPLRLATAEDAADEAAGEEPVDGLALLELHRADELDGAIDELGLSATRRDLLVGLLDDIGWALDAVDDAATFESVHQLVVGNFERAGAAMDAFGTQGGNPPELAGVRTPRGAMTIDTRVLVLVDAAARDAKRSWSVGTRDRIDPAVDAWVATLLPDPADVGWVATTTAGAEVAMRLAALPVSALDAVYLAANDPGVATAAIQRLADLVLDGDAVERIRPSDSGGAPVSLADFQLLSLEIRRLLDESTPAKPATLRSPEHPAVADVALAETLARVDTVVASASAAFGVAAQATTWADLPADAAVELARAGLAPPVGDDADTAGVEAKAMAEVAARASRRLRQVEGAAEPASLDEARDRVAALLGASSPVLAAFDYQADPSADVLFSDALTQPDDVDDWLDALGGARPQVGRLARVLLLADMASPGAAELAAGQAPLLDGDRWAALHRPAPRTGGRVAVAAVTHGDVSAGRSLVGLVVDQWAERLPRPDQVTGVTFQFDAPSNQAPQTMLLAVPPDDESWSLDLVVDTILETVEWAMLRTVAIDDLGDYGHALPTTFAPGELSPYMPVGTAP